MYVCMCVCMYVCMYVSMYLCIHVCMYECLHIAKDTYVCFPVISMHTYMHTGTEALWEALRVSGLAHVWYRQLVPANIRS